jgi:hypothetical protein
LAKRELLEEPLADRVELHHRGDIIGRQWRWPAFQFHARPARDVPDRSSRIAVLVQLVPHCADRRLGHRLQRPMLTGLPTASSKPLLRLVGVPCPRCLDLRGVPRAIRLAPNAARLLGLAHGGLAHAKLAGERAITGHAHP